MKAGATETESGFTLVEILVATMITAVILTVLTASFLVFFSNSSYVSGRDDHAAGAEVLSSFLDRDLASATNTPTTATSAACPVASATQTLLTLTWTEYQAPASPSVLGDDDPVVGTTYSVQYQLKHDTDAVSTSQACMVQRVYQGNTLVLAHNVQSAGLSIVPSTNCASGNQLIVTLAQYQTDNAPSFTYNGCLKARTNAI